MAWFRLLRGRFHYHGRTIVAKSNGPSDPFESAKDLDKIFPNKFARIEGEPNIAPKPVARTVVQAQAEARKRVVIPTPAVLPVPPAPKAPDPVAKRNVAPSASSTPAGVDVTEKFEDAARVGMRVYRKGIHYTAINEEGITAVSNLGQKAMQEFLSKEAE